jgi:hypothetical protein
LEHSAPGDPSFSEYFPPTEPIPVVVKGVLKGKRGQSSGQRETGELRETQSKEVAQEWGK